MKSPSLHKIFRSMLLNLCMCTTYSTTTTTRLDNNPNNGELPKSCATMFPDNVLILILSKLPVISLLRFRCISKSCLCLINDNSEKLPSAMAGLFYQNNNCKVQFIGLKNRTYTDSSSSVDTKLSFLPSHDLEELSVRDCCNGLLLLAHVSDLWMYVCNPATRKYARISRPPTKPSLLVLAFDPNLSSHYKVISFPCRCNENSVEVFSSETNRWEVVRGFYGNHQVNFPKFAHVAFLNGAVYALDISRDTYAINVTNRSCRKIEGRSRRREAGLYIQFLGHSQGVLHHALFTGGEVVVQVLEDPKSNKYVMKHRNYIRATIVNKVQYVDLLSFHPDVDVIFLRTERKLLSYHLGKGQVEEICSIGREGRCFPYSPCYFELEGLDMDAFGMKSEH